MSPKVEAIIKLMRANLCRDLPLKELAARVKLSPSYLCFLFKRQTGQSPSRYLKDLRMQQARELLETTLLTVKEITAKVGLKDESHFMRDFKRVYGLTPSQYRTHYLSLNRGRPQP